MIYFLLSAAFAEPTAEAEAECTCEASEACPTEPTAPTLALASQSPSTYQELEPINGAKVLLVEDHRAPIVELQLIIPTGTWSSWSQENHLEEAFTHLAYHPDGSLRKEINLLAANVSATVYSTSTYYTIRVLKEDIDEALDLSLRILKNREIDAAELKRWKKGADIEWEGNLKEPSFQGKMEVLKLLFPEDNDVRRLSHSEPPPVETDPDALVGTLDTFLSSPNKIVAFAGDITAEESTALATKFLAELQQDGSFSCQGFYAKKIPTW